MSKSLKRGRAALEAADVRIEIRETASAYAAAYATTVPGCGVNQIGKSI